MTVIGLTGGATLTLHCSPHFQAWHKRRLNGLFACHRRKRTKTRPGVTALLPILRLTLSHTVRVRIDGLRILLQFSATFTNYIQAHSNTLVLCKL